MASKQNKFLKLYEPIHDRFERFCRARVYGDMDYKDLMNETLLIAYTKFDTLKSEQAFLSFLFTIAVRFLANTAKKAKKELSDVSVNLSSIKAEGSGSESSAEVYLLHEALALLPEIQREAIILFEISGFSIKDIMVIQNAKESTVKQRLKRGRERLTAILTFESTHQRGEVSHG
ncbi:MAG: RNA polymerase sigma factor [Putridiphycobacter sp.]|nr:RNA polymerase sigma factor [Putridiphycobacter sp.]